MLAIGCSIKEDRSDCPCMLDIDFSGIDAQKHSSALVAVEASGGFAYTELVGGDRYGEQYRISVPRSGVYVNISSGGERHYSTGGGFSVIQGEDFPPLYLQSVFCSTDKEQMGIKARLYKSYCRIGLHLKADAPYPYSISVKGNFSGYNADGRVKRGDFRFSPAPDEDGKCSVSVPRQEDSSLRLIIEEDGNVLREFAIGEYIIESGYDWSAPDLEDVEIEIDYSKTDVVFTVNDWEKTVSFEVII